MKILFRLKTTLESFPIIIFFVISKIVEKNPTKFRIDGAELAIRKGFIESTKEEVRRMKERLTNQSRGNLERVANQVQG